MLRDKLRSWTVGGISVVAIYESAHQLGLFDRLEWSDEQHLHALELLMVVFLLARGWVEKRKQDAAAQ